MADKKLDIFYVLEQIDQQNFDFYASLSAEEQKSISMWVLMRWTSLVTGSLADDYLMNTNNCVNVDFNDMSNHPELQWKLLCLVGSGRKQRHQFAKPPKGRTKNKLQAALHTLFPEMKSDELDMVESLNTPEQLKSIFIDAGWTDREIKEVLP